MILTRLGNKRRIVGKILQYTPPHNMFIELFFGAGGFFFNKPKVKYNILNDLDSEVFNLFMVVKNQHIEFEKAINNMPIHNDLFQYWRSNYEVDPVLKAVRFIFLSNCGFLGKPETLRIGANNPKQMILERLKTCNAILSDCQFTNVDFRDVMRRISIKDNDKSKVLIYADPPYLETDNNYEFGFKEQDSSDLFDLLQESDFNFAMSEENHPFILDQARKRKLNVITIGERQSLKKRSLEILIIQHPSLTFFNNKNHANKQNTLFTETNRGIKRQQFAGSLHCR